MPIHAQKNTSHGEIKLIKAEFFFFLLERFYLNSNGSSMAGRPGLTVAERAIEDGLVKPLGEGGFGAVWLWRGPSGEMAVKIVQKNTGKKHRNVNILLQTRTEASTMANLKHPNIVALHHFLETDSSLYLCLQLCHGGDLLDLINSSGRLPQWIAKVYFRQLMEAVKYVHDQGYIHRDIKVRLLGL